MERIRQFGFDGARSRRHFVTRQHPIGSLANIGPSANRRDPPLQRIDVPGHVVEFADARRDIIGAEIALRKVLPQSRDETGVNIGAALTEVRQGTGFPEPAHHACAPDIGSNRFVRQALERGQVDGFRGKAQCRITRRCLQIRDQRRKRIEARFRLAPVEVGERREPMFLDRIDFFFGKFGRRAVLVRPGERAESPVTLVTASPPGDLGHFRGKKPAHPDPVEF